MTKIIDTYYGTILADISEDDLISRCLVEYGEWGLLECYFASKILPRGYVAIDIGAFLGTFSLGLSMFGASKIISVEPNPLVLPSLKQNLDANSRIPYTLIEAPVGKNDGRNWSLAVDDSNLGGTRLIETDTKLDNSVTPIELAEIRSLHGPYDFLKIDAEGHEGSIIESDKSYISQQCKIVFFEENEDSQHIDTIKFLLDNEFHLYFCIFPSYNCNNYNSSKNRLLNIACEANILASKEPVSLDDELKKLGCHIIHFKTIEEFENIRCYVPRWGEESWNNLNKIELQALLGKAILQLNSAIYS